MSIVLVTLLTVIALHFAMRCREQARVIRALRRNLEARDEKLVLLHRNIVTIAGKWALEKQESARLRAELDARIPTDADIDQWMRAGRS